MDSGAAPARELTWSTVSAPSPPASSSTPPDSPMRTAQGTRVTRGGSVRPPGLRTSTTSEAETADEMKNRVLTTNAMDMRPDTTTDPTGSSPKNWNSVVSVLTTPSGPTRLPRSSWYHRPVLPKMVNHTRDTAVGASRIPRRNSRMVRPREIRAMNIPTNGAHARNQAWLNSVQLSVHPSSAPAPVSNASCGMVCAYSPMFCTIIRSRNTVGPTNSTTTAI